VASTATGFLTAEPTREEARRGWPRWLALGVAMIAVAVVGALWDAGGASLLLGAIGVFLVVRGAALLRRARTGALDAELSRSATRLGGAVIAVGALGAVAALVSAELAAGVLLVAVPLALVGAGLVLVGRGGLARRGGMALLVWAALVSGLLVVTGVARGWSAAGDVATVVTALVVAVLGVPMLVAAANLRALASAPEPAPARPAACAGCACGAGGCGS
jgi:hypothetical protein